MSTGQADTAMAGDRPRSRPATSISPASCAARATTSSTCAPKAGARSSCSGIARRAATTCWRSTARRGTFRPLAFSATIKDMKALLHNA